MERAGLPRQLIRYSTSHALQEGLTGAQTWRRVLRPRVMIYSGVLLAIVAALVLALVLRVPLKVDVIRDRGALAREVEDGLVENVYRLQVMNTTEAAQAYSVTASGLPGLAVASEQVFDVPAATTRSVVLRLRASAAEVAPGSHKVALEVKAQGNAAIGVREHTTFLGLRP
jgi:polyferredoxin